MFAEIRNFSEGQHPRKTGSRRRSSKTRSDPASCAQARWSSSSHEHNLVTFNLVAYQASATSFGNVILICFWNMGSLLLGLNP
jgi:hypothetical protein